MYTSVYSMDVYEDHRTYALKTVQADVHGTTRRTLLFEYPLVNTWTYKAALDRWAKTTECTPLWSDVCYFARGVVGSPLLLIPPTPFSFFTHF
jgi:hypothetical protein